MKRTLPVRTSYQEDLSAIGNQFTRAVISSLSVFSYSANRDKFRLKC